MSEYLLDGDLVVVRGLPRTGKTNLAQALFNEFQETAVFVAGREFTENNQADLIQAIIEELKQKAESAGISQLIFDDYGAALRRSHGGRLQSQLYGLLVDSEYSRDIGAVFFSRWQGPIHIPLRGSPLISRARFFALPTFDSADLIQYGWSSLSYSSVQADIGHLAVSLMRSQVVGSRLLTSSLEQSIKADAPLIVGDLPSDAVEFLAGARTQEGLSGEAFESLLPLVWDNDDKIGIAQVPQSAGILRAIQGMAPGWPDSRNDSSKRFAQLVAGWDKALWCDRYLYQDPPRLESFLSSLRGRTATNLRLLGAIPMPDTGYTAADVRAAISSYDGVEARFMNRADYRLLHDRHLVHVGADGGFVLPVCRVIFGVDRAGSAVAAPVARFGITYADFWRRASPV
ncbi:AAA family ATPase [Actinoplanes philippinensis]|uniref:AAA family ATPase n=1 Tax=Actinoplanes philippinensis TaxID=35752 RepID=UPI0033FD8B80